MKKEDELFRQLTDLLKDTQAGKVRWDVKCQKTEYNDKAKKPVEKDAEGVEWTVDECFVSYYCLYKGKEFLMITYEMIHSAGDKVRTTNMIFLPPLGIRFFDVNTLLPYAVEVNQMLSYQAHMLWLSCVETYRNHPDRIAFDMSERTLSIEEETK